MEATEGRGGGERSTPIGAVVDASSDHREGTDSLECFPAQNINVVHQRRRVNPESLALRLGPELVRDLDALIVSGNMEMPSFAVRKELQERYNIDRRHIYDYFHSRGLRVVKEDKHVLPKDPVPTVPLPNLRPLRQAPSRSHPSYSVTTDTKWSIAKPRGITKAKPGRPKKNPPNLKIASTTACEPSASGAITPVISDDSPPSPATSPAYVTINPLLHHAVLPAIPEDEAHPTFDSVINPLDESLVAPAIGDTTYFYRHKPVFDRMTEPNEHSLNFTYERSLALPRNEMSPCSASDMGLLLPHAKPLSCTERQAIYQTLSENLGPACGIQESQGTYRKHMEDRGRLYYEGLLSVPHHYSHKSDRPSASMKRTLGTDEFRFWLSEAKFLNGSPRPKHDVRGANIARQHAVAPNDKRDGQRVGYGRHWGPTLDDLFPTPLQDFSDRFDVTESPITHTGSPPHMALQFFTLPENEYRQGDDVPFSTIFDQSISVPLAQSVSVIQSHRSRFHGLAGFPGPQGPMITTDMEKLQRLELQSSPCSAFLSSGSTGLSTLQDSDEMLRRSRKEQNNARTRFVPCSPYKPQLRDRDRIRTRSVTSRGARRRTPSAAGGI